jgi:hypothetical protein
VPHGYTHLVYVCTHVAYDGACSLAGTADSRVRNRDNFTEIENKACRSCSLGTYQPYSGQLNCLHCPLAEREQEVPDPDTGDTLSPRSSTVWTGQVSVDSCVCAPQFYRSPEQLCDTGTLVIPPLFPFSLLLGSVVLCFVCPQPQFFYCVKF